MTALHTNLCNIACTWRTTRGCGRFRCFTVNTVPILHHHNCDTAVHPVLHVCLKSVSSTAQCRTKTYHQQHRTSSALLLPQSATMYFGEPRRQLPTVMNFYSRISASIWQPAGSHFPAVSVFHCLRCQVNRQLSAPHVRSGTSWLHHL
jgi:hypothetical protein